MLILTYFIQIVSSQSCYPYQCAPSDYNMPSTYCAQLYNYTLFFLKPCPNSQTCDLTTGQCEAIPTTSQSLNYPGEPCAKNSDCSSKNCTLDKCIGAAFGAFCTQHENCNPGLRCSESVCTKQIDVTGFGCINDYDCINSASCNTTGSTVAGTCIEYFSVPIGLPVSDCSGGVSYMCKSSECSKTFQFGTIGICKTSTTSIHNTPYVCSSDYNCMGTDGVYQYTSDCVCGFNSNGTSYCTLFNGDLQGQVYYTTWQQALVQSISVCNTARRFTNQCLLLTNYYSKVLTATWNFYYYPQMQNNDACVRGMITYEGYDDNALLIFVIFSLYLA